MFEFEEPGASVVVAVDVDIVVVDGEWVQVEHKSVVDGKDFDMTENPLGPLRIDCNYIGFDIDSFGSDTDNCHQATVMPALLSFIIVINHKFSSVNEKKDKICTHSVVLPWAVV